MGEPTTPEPSPAQALRDRDKLALIASLAAIALDAASRERRVDYAPVKLLAALLERGITPLRPVKIKGKARLADPDTADLLYRVARKATPDAAPDLKEVQKVAKRFVDFAQKEPDSTIERDVLIELRDFALQLSKVARVHRRSILIRAARMK